MSRRTVSFPTDYGEASAEVWTCDNKACHKQATVQQTVFWLSARIIAVALALSPIKPSELSVKGLEAVRHECQPPNWPRSPNQLLLPYNEETGDWTPRGNTMRKIIYEGALSGADSQRNALTLEVNLENTEKAAASAEELDNIAPTLDEVRGGALVPVRVTVEILAERAGHRGDPVEVRLPRVYVRDSNVFVDD